VAEHTLTSFQAAIDHPRVADFVNVMADLASAKFTFSAERLTEINGAPLSAGPHTLYLVAADSGGLTSPVTQLTFTLDLSAQGSVVTDVTPSATAGSYDYRYTVSGPTDAGWVIDTLTIPVPAGSSVSALVTPAGWTAQTGSGKVQWSAGAGAALTAGASL